MPATRFAILLAGVIAAAGLSVALGASLVPEGTTGPAIMGGVLAGAMLLRLIVGRWRNGH